MMYLQSLREPINVPWQHENSAVPVRNADMHASRKVHQYWQFLPTSTPSQQHCTGETLAQCFHQFKATVCLQHLVSTLLIKSGVSRSLKHWYRLALCEGHVRTACTHASNTMHTNFYCTLRRFQTPVEDAVSG